MSLINNIFRLIPPTLRPNYCPTPQTYQQLANDIIGGTQLTMLIDIGSVYYNLGPTTPAAENRSFPWINTANGLLWIFRDGVWTSPRPKIDQSFRWMWKPANGTLESALWSLDGGDGTDPATVPPTLISGSMWAVDHEMDGLIPIGIGNIPGTDPVVTISLNQEAGEYEHTLTAAEGAVWDHTHLFGLMNQAPGDDAFFRQSTLQTVASYTGAYITGSGPTIVESKTSADLRTLPSGNGEGVTDPTPFKILPKVKGVWWVKPTGRIYFTLPA